MSANTVTDAASAVSATNTASLAATITAASIHAAASIAASIAQRSYQWHSDAISMHQSQSACVLALSEAAVAEHKQSLCRRRVTGRERGRVSAHAFVTLIATLIATRWASARPRLLLCQVRQHHLC